MRITANGKQLDIAPDTSIQDLLGRLGMDASRVAVECNRRIVFRDEFGSIRLSEGDELELVQFVGGG